MTSRYLLGPQKYSCGRWKSDPNGKRPVGGATLHPMDLALFTSEVERLGAKSILEFGPGDSTEFFAKMGLQVTTCEHDQHWYEVAVERFKDMPNVRVLKCEDEMPVVVHGLGDDERFDLAFVDAPQGYRPRRKIHKGYEDCSRFNTTLFALQHATVALLHDTQRPAERGTLNRLHLMGYKIELINVPYGVARIICQQPAQTSSIAPSAT